MINRTFSDSLWTDQVLVGYLTNNAGAVEVDSLNATISVARLAWLDYLGLVPSPDHFSVFQYFVFCVLVVSVLTLVAYIVSPITFQSEKTTAYECGFQPFGDARTSFDVHFYLVGILFLIFDLEVVYLFPWLFSFVEESDFLYGNIPSMVFFLVCLGVGFVYEWKQNALLWTPLRHD